MRMAMLGIAATLLLGGCAADVKLADEPHMLNLPPKLDINLMNYCLQHQQDQICKGGAPATAVELTSEKVQQLYQINHQVNTSITWTAGGPSWEPKDGKGLCSSYVFPKYRQLVAAGWPPGAFHIAEVSTVPGAVDNHAVLLVEGIVHGVKGMYILSNTHDGMPAIQDVDWGMWHMYDPQKHQLLPFNA